MVSPRCPCALFDFVAVDHKTEGAGKDNENEEQEQERLHGGLLFIVFQAHVHGGEEQHKCKGVYARLFESTCSLENILCWHHVLRGTCFAGQDS